MWITVVWDWADWPWEEEAALQLVWAQLNRWVGGSHWEQCSPDKDKVGFSPILRIYRQYHYHFHWLWEEEAQQLVWAQQVGGSSALLTRTRWAPISGSHIAPISIVIILIVVQKGKLLSAQQLVWAQQVGFCSHVLNDIIIIYCGRRKPIFIVII